MFIYLWLGHAACRLLVPWSGIEPELPAVEVQSLSHCTTALCNRHSIFTDHEKVWSQATCPQSFFYHPMDCSLPGSSVHGICQAGILDWGAISFSRGSSWPRDQTWVSCIGRQFLYHWASRSKLWEIVEDRRAWQATAHGVAESDTTWELNNSRHSYTAAQLKPEISKRLY